MKTKQLRKNKRKKLSAKILPAIPDKIYFSIREVSHLCAVPASVLRYWEGEFSQLKPTKQSGNRRLYQRKDIQLIREIRHLLYLEGYTIEGARLRLSNKLEPVQTSGKNNTIIKKIIADLENVLQNLQS